MGLSPEIFSLLNSECWIFSAFRRLALYFWISKLVKESMDHLKVKHVSLKSSREGLEDKKDVESI